MAASLVREDMPWLYELAVEAYRVVRTGDPEAIEREMKPISRLSELLVRGPFFEEFGGKETHMIAMEFPGMLERMLLRAAAPRKEPETRKAKSQPQSSA